MRMKARCCVLLTPMAFTLAICLLPGLLSNAVGAPAVGVDVGYDLLVTSAGDNVPRTCFKVPQLPASTRGAFFISGPAKFEMGGYHFKSFFDGYGRINRFELHDELVCYTGKFLNSSYLEHAESLGRISNGPTFYGVEPELPFCPLQHPMCFLTGAQSDNNWVNILPLNGEGLMLTDSPIFVRLNYDSLTVQAGDYPWSDAIRGSSGVMPGFLKRFHVPATGSAHPVMRPGTTSTYVEVMLELAVLPLSTNALAVYNIDVDSMNRTLVAHVPMKGAQYFHSFGVSEHYVVLPCNLKMGVPKDSEGLISAFEDGWDGIHVVDLNGNIQVFETDPFFHVHIANTFENGTGIVMDVGTFKDLPFAPHTLSTTLFVNKTARDVRNFGQHVERIHLHLTGSMAGKVTREKVSPPGRQTDFFKINGAFNGAKYCFFYAVEWFHDDEAYASMAVLKHDMCKGTRTYWSKMHQYPSEPFFIPKTNSTDLEHEDEGLLAFVVLNGDRGKSDFVILDAKTFEEVAVIELPDHIPFLAHGQFISSWENVKSALEFEAPGLADAIDSTFVV